MMHRFSCEPNNYESWSTLKLGWAWYRLACLSLPVIFYWSIQGDASFVDPFCYLCFTLTLLYCLFCSLQLCDHLLGKGWPLGDRACDVPLCFCHLPISCLGSCVVLDCIDSWSLPFSLLWFQFEPVHEISNNVVCATSKTSDQPAHTRKSVQSLS